MSDKKIESSKGSKGLSVKKSDNFSEWYSEVVQKAELADLRYNVKGFLVFQPWSVMTMENMYKRFEEVLQRKGHRPYFFPTLIPEENLRKESSHIKGFTPEVFWVTHGGETKFSEKLALRPTSETAFYQMFSLWIRSYKDLPFKAYQRANVFRYETKATRPFLRSREFHWIETHCAFPSEAGAEKQVREDMDTTKEVLHDTFGLPFIFFERPQWDKFPGADKTFAADVLNPDGKVVQQPSTHVISESFSKAFEINYTDRDGVKKPARVTCYGPAISRIFASVVIVHGDDSGLRLPWSISPVQIAIVPIGDDREVMKKANELRSKFEKFRVEIDSSDKSPGEKFNLWELRGVPLRIDVGRKEIDGKNVAVFRRDKNKKEMVSEKDLVKHVEKISMEFDKNLISQADSMFKNRIHNAKTVAEIKKILESGGIARCQFCSIDSGAKCGSAIEEKTGGKVRGKSLENEKATGNCVSCGKKSNDVVYVAREY